MINIERVIKYLLAFMWITWLLDIASTVIALNMGDFFYELNQLFDIGGWTLMIGFNFILRSVITIIVVLVYKLWSEFLSFAMAVYISIVGYLAVASIQAAGGNLRLVVQLLIELKGG